VQVADASLAKLVVVSGGPASDPIVVRLTDVNGLAYPGAHLTASGSVAPGSATTNAQGQAVFHWTPASSGASQLTISVDAAPAVSVTLSTGAAGGQLQ